MNYKKIFSTVLTYSIIFIIFEFFSVLILSDTFANSPYRYWIIFLPVLIMIIGYFKVVEILVHDEPLYQDFIIKIRSAYNKTPISALSTNSEWAFFLAFFIMFIICFSFTSKLLEVTKFSSDVLIFQAISIEDRQKWEALKSSADALLGIYFSLTIIFMNFSREIITEANGRKERDTINLKMDIIVKKLDEIQKNAKK
jgi:hypothetical protein